ncbi:MAG: hypothetical protein M1538_00620 [Candidatus Marsarchaeota archaeon]|nr:hypothetical protein [Candidatus Marsarchaeota archaeon]
MGFNNILINARINISEARFVLNFRERPNISKSVLDKEGAIYIEKGEIKEINYNFLEPRYIAITSLSYDFAITLYNVNRKSALIYRIYNNNNFLIKKLSSDISRFNNDDIEVRLFGFQTNYYNNLFSSMVKFIISKNIEIYEVDLLGNEIRNIALDIKTGQTFNILMENRLYKPGELINKQTIEEFEADLTLQSKKSSTNLVGQKPHPK